MIKNSRFTSGVGVGNKNVMYHKSFIVYFLYENTIYWTIWPISWIADFSLLRNSNSARNPFTGRPSTKHRHSMTLRAIRKPASTYMKCIFCRIRVLVHFILNYIIYNMLFFHDPTFPIITTRGWFGWLVVGRWKIATPFLLVRVKYSRRLLVKNCNFCWSTEAHPKLLLMLSDLACRRPL